MQGISNDQGEDELKFFLNIDSKEDDESLKDDLLTPRPDHSLAFQISSRAERIRVQPEICGFGGGEEKSSQDVEEIAYKQLKNIQTYAGDMRDESIIQAVGSSSYGVFTLSKGI